MSIHSIFGIRYGELFSHLSYFQQSLKCKKHSHVILLSCRLNEADIRQPLDESQMCMCSGNDTKLFPVLRLLLRYSKEDRALFHCVDFEVKTSISSLIRVGSTFEVAINKMNSSARKITILNGNV